tara:strand:+ start:664 stop:1302 length:639 start_codon:yes stop_codon:yes gene_type:complete
MQNVPAWQLALTENLSEFKEIVEEKKLRGKIAGIWGCSKNTVKSRVERGELKVWEAVKLSELPELEKFFVHSCERLIQAVQPRTRRELQWEISYHYGLLQPAEALELLLLGRKSMRETEGLSSRLSYFEESNTAALSVLSSIEPARIDGLDDKYGLVYTFADQDLMTRMNQSFMRHAGCSTEDWYRKLLNVAEMEQLPRKGFLHLSLDRGNI